MNLDKVKQLVALWGGFLGTVVLFLKSLNVEVSWLNETTIASSSAVLVSLAAFVIAAYGVYKNTYVVTKKAKEQEEVLKKEGLK